ncbi:MAG: hypothetical protein K6A37_05270 [Saccharofermentans sp.]|nr:hypothetical protein [Saccharofermentans sp.]
MKKAARKVIITTACILLISVITAAAALVLLKIKTDSINDEYGKVVTSTGKSFLEQMNLRFPQYTTTMNKYQI